jgi:hypothetical protein
MSSVPQLARAWLIRVAEFDEDTGQAHMCWAAS